MDVAVGWEGAFDDAQSGWTGFHAAARRPSSITPKILDDLIGKEA
jgi:hypothetical protein